MADYFSEHLVAAHRQQLEIAEIIHQDYSGSQEIAIFRNPLFGTVMALDGAIQTTTGDEFIYHEMLTHVPILAHGAVKNVLIIGGGDGGILRHALMHKNIERVVMVEIEPLVIDLTKKYMPSICGDAFNDKRSQVLIDDGYVFVRDTAERFDIIIVDSTDPQGPGEVLFTAEFYEYCKRCLNPNGIIVTQSGVPFSQPKTIQTSKRELAKSFADVAFYIVTVPTYISGAMALGFASDNPYMKDIALDVLSTRHAQISQTCRYYTPSVHRAAFALPRYIEQLIAAK